MLNKSINYTFISAENNLQNMFSSDVFYVKAENKIIGISFGVIDTISYEDEMKGKTNVMSDLCSLTKNNGIIICGTEMNLFGNINKSAIICEDGALLGVSDSIISYENKYEIENLNVAIYTTKIGKLGIIVDKDILSFELISLIKNKGAEMIICALNDNIEKIYKSAALTYSTQLNIPIMIIAKNQSIVSVGDKQKIIKTKKMLKIDLLNDTNFATLGYIAKKSIYKSLNNF